MASLASSPTLNIFRKDFSRTASYIYTRDPRNGEFLFAFARKIPENGRVRIKGSNTGSAGTKSEYCGKWGSFGGSVDSKSKHMLAAAITEIAEEGNISGLSYQDVDISLIGGVKKNALIQLQLVKQINGTVIFLFCVHFSYFKRLFPIFPKTRGGADIVTSSKGEIDLVSSFSFGQIIELQNNEITQKKNNFVLSYVVESFNQFIKPEIEGLSSSFSRHSRLSKVDDKRSRTIRPTPKYTEISIGKYV